MWEISIVADQIKSEDAAPPAPEDRRAFLAKAGRVAVAAPAAALLLAATAAKSKPISGLT
jgi:hypothetical protein